MSTLKVSLISTLPPHMGVADYAAHLVTGLASDRSISLEVIDFASLYPRWLYPGGKIQDSTARRPQWPTVRVRSVLRWYNPLSWLLAGLTLRGDVVHAQWWSHNLGPMYLVLLAMARLRGRRVVVTVHNVEPHEPAGWKRLLNRLVLGLAHRHIVHTASAQHALAAQTGDQKRVTVVPHGILASQGRPATRVEARSSLGVSPSARVILFFGNVRPYKGLATLLRALADVRARVDNALLIVAGNVWEDWTPYQRLIDELGLADIVRTRLEFIPAEEVGAYFSAADVVALPYSHFEAQSGIGARAIYHGRALVVARAGGLPELTDDERCVVPPGDVEGLAAAITAVLTDDGLRRKLEQAAEARARELRWDAIAEKTAAIYRAVAARGDELADEEEAKAGATSAQAAEEEQWSLR